MTWELQSHRHLFPSLLIHYTWSATNQHYQYARQNWDFKKPSLIKKKKIPNKPPNLPLKRPEKLPIDFEMQLETPISQPLRDMFHLIQPSWDREGGYLEDHPRTCKWLITMVRFRPLRIGLFPKQLDGMILQVVMSSRIFGGDPSKFLENFQKSTQSKSFLQRRTHGINGPRNKNLSI